MYDVGLAVPHKQLAHHLHLHQIICAACNTLTLSLTGYQITGSEVTKSNKVAATGDDNYILRLSRSSTGKLTVEDVQGNKATVLSGPVKAGKINVFVIDKVLLSGEFNS